MKKKLIAVLLLAAMFVICIVPLSVLAETVIVIGPPSNWSALS